MIGRALFALALVAAAPVGTTPNEVRLNRDWVALGHHTAANAALVPTPGAPRIVLMGDSITESWLALAPAFFVAGRIDRGISGQTWPQMLLRFRQDVIDLHPDVVHIMAGTNDIAGNTGAMTAEQTEANIASMTELARAHSIRVILASIPPADHMNWRPGLETAAKIAAINAWLRDYAARTGAVYADYWGALHDGDAMRALLTRDGVHPNAEGYAAMAPVADAAIRAAIIGG